MFPQDGSWCHRCGLHSTSLCFRENHRSCWQRVLFCQGALFFSPCATCPTLAQHGSGSCTKSTACPSLSRCLGSTSHQCSHPPPATPPSTLTSPHFISLCSSLLASLRAALTQMDPINPSCDLSLTLTSRAAHKMNRHFFIKFSPNVKGQLFIFPMFPDGLEWPISNKMTDILWG